MSRYPFLIQEYKVDVENVSELEKRPTNFETRSKEYEMPLREYLCDYCAHQFEELVYGEPEDYQYAKCRCGSQAKVLPAMIGGYNGNTGSSSTRPKNSTSMPKKKAFTGHPGNQGEPETKDQLDLIFDSGE